ncbi:MAG: TonB-dependent receptor [Deltaproteobacteria bacterium]|nr:TonB-dependent receptor [Deltaproteobacteria bacterium]
MSIPSPRASLAFIVVTGGALVVLGLGVACKKTEPRTDPQTAPQAQAPGAVPPAGTAAPGTAAAAANAPGVLGKGVIRGTVHFTGKAPEAKPITTPDPFCARQALKEEEVVVAPGGGLKNVLIRVTKGATGTYDAPKADAVVDQSGCVYRPRVQAVMPGQTVQIKNSDQTLHNVHTYKGASTVFNQAQIPGMGPMSKTFSDGGQIIKFKCDVHPWMTGYVAVATNPFFAVSAADGSFAIDKLPAGTYTLEAWHERLGSRTADVTVTETDPAKATFDFTGA